MSPTSTSTTTTTTTTTTISANNGLDDDGPTDPFCGILPLPTTPTDYDVIVSGAGPVGLLLGCQLRALGMSVALVDPHLGSGLGGSKAAITMPRSLEVMGLAGGDVAPSLFAEGRPVYGARVGSGSSWLGGATGFSTGLGPDHPVVGGVYSRYGPMTLGQDRIEARLAHRYVVELGGTIYRAARVISVEEGDDSASVGVERHVYARPPAVAPDLPSHLTENTEATLTAKFVVGADGKNSKVREQLGLAFVGKEYDQVFFLTDVEVAEGEAERCGWEGYGLNVVTEADGTLVLFVPIQGNVYRTYYCKAGINPDDCTEEFLRSEWERRVPGGFGMNIVRFEKPAVFRISCRLSARYSSVGGRVLLAGDAAHCHSPAGGQGMNTGLQDAANLAWKLADAVRRGAGGGDSLLSTYEAERRPIAEWVLHNTDAIFSDVTQPKSKLLSGLRNVGLRILLAVAPSGSLPPISLRDRVFGLSLSYRDVGSCVDSGDRPLRGALVAGDRLPDVPHRRIISGDGGVSERNESELLHDFLGPLSVRHTLMVVSGGPEADEGGEEGSGAVGEAVSACVMAASKLENVSKTILVVRDASNVAGFAPCLPDEGGVRIVELEGLATASLTSLLRLGPAGVATVAVRPDTYLAFVHRGSCDMTVIESGLNRARDHAKIEKEN